MLRDVIVAIAARSREMMKRYEARERNRFDRARARVKRTV